MITCYYCQHVLDVDDYTAWELGWHYEDDGDTAVCPKCEMDFEEFNDFDDEV